MRVINNSYLLKLYFLTLYTHLTRVGFNLLVFFIDFYKNFCYYIFVMRIVIKEDKYNRYI